MDQLLALLMGILAWLSPLLLVGGRLALAGWRDRRTLAAVASQTRLSDALADEVGTIVAPVVEKRGGAWCVRVAVPLGRPAVVARILGVPTLLLTLSAYRDAEHWAAMRAGWPDGDPWRPVLEGRSRAPLAAPVTTTRLRPTARSLIRYRSEAPR